MSLLFLLHAAERAAMEDNPADYAYGEKRRALVNGIEQLERDLAAARAERDEARAAAKTWENEAERRSRRYEACVVERDALAGALRAIAEGCSFPADDVQRAVRDRARAALAAVERKEG